MGADRGTARHTAESLGIRLDRRECLGLHLVAAPRSSGTASINGRRRALRGKARCHFNGGHNVHSNEPSHHYGYLYDFAGQPWKTQAKSAKLPPRNTATTQGGLDGDDDCGQMSAWLLFTAMGFYPVNPASGDYMIGSPLLQRHVDSLSQWQNVPRRSAG